MRVKTNNLINNNNNNNNNNNSNNNIQARVFNKDLKMQINLINIYQ